MILAPIRPPKTHLALAFKETAVEARHFAATLALFRVCNMKNLHMMLPPFYRALWKGEFQAIKVNDMKIGDEWLYRSDPFQALRDHEKDFLQLKRRQEASRVKSAEAAGHHGVPGRSRGWANATTIDMGKATRSLVQELAQKHGRWNTYGLVLSDEQKADIVQEFVKKGFRKSHVCEAADECGDREEILYWLLSFVPDDDLPGWSLPDNYVAGVSLAHSNIGREATLKRLSAGGYGVELCSRILDQHGDSEVEAAEALQQLLVQDLEYPSNNTAINKMTTIGEEPWIEECKALEAVYGHKMKPFSGLKFQIVIEPSGLDTLYELHVQKSKHYPETEPVVNLVNKNLPAYIKLSIIRQVVSYVRSTSIGEPTLFIMLDYLTEDLQRILQAPIRLRELSNVSIMPQPAHPRLMTSKNGRKPSSFTATTKFEVITSQKMLTDWHQKQDQPAQQKMFSNRQRLPAWALKDEIVKTVEQSQVTVISGDTGSGKSTQTVQFVLDDMIQRCVGSSANIICTQPRRISALSLASRVSEERCSGIGDEVGYSVRGESKRVRGRTRILFVTTGVLLRRLQNAGGNLQEVASSVSDLSHIVIDEVHERSMDTDFLLTLLKEVVTNHVNLKLILMSATMDSQGFEDYFRETGVSVGRVKIPGRIFPIDDYYLDDIIQMTGFGAPKLSGGTLRGSVDVAKIIRDLGPEINYELVARTVAEIDSRLDNYKNSILVFLPGEPEINRSIEVLRRIPNINILPLHGSLSPTEQRRVFAPPAQGKRKVVVATNIAETSITVADVVAVVDSGKVKERILDVQTSLSKLAVGWASQAACQQRRGRAGRVQPGECYKLYTRTMSQAMEPLPQPEILRIPLEQLCLSVRAMGLVDIRGFLGQAPTPPRPSAVEEAIELLTRMGALNNGHLTALGRHLSAIPADLRCGKLLVYGALFGCFENCLTIAAVLSARSPFFSPPDKREAAKAKRKSFSSGNGDLVADLHAYHDWKQRDKACSRAAIRSWCDDHFLSLQTFREISMNSLQYLATLKEIGFVPQEYSDANENCPSLNANNDNLSILRALVAGSFSPQVARIEFPQTRYMASVSGAVAQDPEAKTIKYFTHDNGRVFAHPSSTLFDAQSFIGQSVFVAFFTQMTTSKSFIRDLTPFNVYALLMFCGSITVDTEGRGLLIDGWLRLKGWARIGVLATRLRGVLDNLLEQKMEDPLLELSGHEVVQAVIKLMELNGMDE